MLATENINPELQNRLDKAYEIATKKKDYGSAIAVCDRVLNDHPFFMEALRTRARIRAYAGEFSKAIEDISSVIEQGSLEPDDYFSRGRWHLENGNPAGAVIDLTRVIASGFEYYTESAHFFRAVANLRQGRYDDALADCGQVRDDFLIYLRSGQVSKASIVSEAESRRRS